MILTCTYKFFKLTGSYRKECFPRLYLGCMLSQVAPDQGKEGLDIGNKLSRIGDSRSWLRMMKMARLIECRRLEWQEERRNWPRLGRSDNHEGQLAMSWVSRCYMYIEK